MQIVILPEHIEVALTSARPSVPEMERRRLEAIYREFVGEERTKGGLEGGEGSGREVGTRSSLG